MQEPITLDAADLKLLAAVQDNGALTNQELAEKLRLSASQCSRRRARLEEAGLIRGYHAELDAVRLGFGVTVFIFVALSTHSRANARRFRDLIESVSLVQEAHAMTGDSDYLIKAVVPDLKALSALVNDVLLPHDSVERVRSSIVLETLKARARVPIG
jgi:DNA-binding Lrp family transcriptional regulator